MDLPEALGHLQRKLRCGPLLPDAEGRVRVAFKGGLELVLVPAARGRVVAQVTLAELPAAPGPREERLRLLLSRALAMMKTAEEGLALDAATNRPLLWRQLDLATLAAPALEESVARLLDRAEWLIGETATIPAFRPSGPMLFFP